MTIGTKLRVVSGCILFVPLLFAVVCVAVLTIIFTSGNSDIITGNFEATDNISLAYDACMYIDQAYREQLENNGDENIFDVYPDEIHKQGMLYVNIVKNGSEIFTHKSEEYELPKNFESIKKNASKVTGKSFTIEGDNIIFKTDIEHDGDEYEILLLGHTRKISLYERNGKLYLQIFLVNVLFISIVFITIYNFTKILQRSVFKRIEYSLRTLSDGVEKVKSGDLDFRIKYDRHDEFKPICDSFNLMVEYLKESVENTQRHEQNQKEVLMSISHDIFSPLTSIKAYVEGIQNGIAATPEAQKRYLDVIKSKAEQIEKMVSELLFFSRLEYEQESDRNKTMDLKLFIEEYVEASDNDYAVKNVQLSVSHCDEAKVYGDKMLVSRLFTNIIDNSAKYSNKPICHVDISLQSKTDHCVLIISDDGPGVGNANLEHIFEIFFRSDAARQQTKQGSGIGLSTAANIVRKSMRGEIHAENAPNGGLKIIMELPLLKNYDNKNE